jgi:micrococcal nuclease
MIGLWFFLVWPVIASDTGSVRRATVEVVIDGDTVALDSGETIRLAGINTPEIKSGQPFAAVAQQFLEQRVHNRQVLVENATDPVDPHDRTLAYLYTLDGESLQLALLEAGLASAIVIAPNDRHLDEYAAAETRARLAGKGIWGVSTYRPRPAMTMTPKDRGYGFVRGRVQRIVLGKKWLEFHLARNFVILVQRARWQQYFHYSPCRLDQADVVVRGWVSGKGKRLRTKISHPFMLERCADTGQPLCHWSVAASRLTQ